MSTNLSSPSSNTSKKPVLLPWEMLGQVFSFCDQPTLVAVSLVSFGCWELAGPILYQDVEILDLDGLASLFFIDIVPSSPRRRQALSPISRIRTLTIDIQGWQQYREPFFNQGESTATGEDFSSTQSLAPHRLLDYLPSSPLPLQSLTIRNEPSGVFMLFGFLAFQLYPFLNPVEFVHLSLEPEGWTCMSIRFPLDFFTSWTRLERYVLAGLKVDTASLEGMDGDPLYSYWSPPEGGGGGRGSLDVVLDFASRPEAIYGDHHHRGPAHRLVRILRDYELEEMELKRCNLKVVLRVRRDEEEMVRRDLLDVEEKTRNWVRVEVV